MLFFRYRILLFYNFKDLHHALILVSSFFKTLIDHEVTVELKNNIQLRGTLKSVDQYLNIKLDGISVVEELMYPHLVRISRLAHASSTFSACSWNHSADGVMCNTVQEDERISHRGCMTFDHSMEKGGEMWTRCTIRSCSRLLIS